ncbi:hypothetical protein ACHAWU_008836 [Discostella pseudostelligera]|uniref:Uncharacterized protein n=1 Tax=Discostella pseudostelligera TaxID=259834 RepID=A0ABD3N158_9STRA
MAYRYVYDVDVHVLRKSATRLPMGPLVASIASLMMSLLYPSTDNFAVMYMKSLLSLFEADKSINNLRHRLEVIILSMKAASFLGSFTMASP